MLSRGDAGNAAMTYEGERAPRGGEPPSRVRVQARVVSCLDQLRHVDVDLRQHHACAPRQDAPSVDCRNRSRRRERCRWIKPFPRTIGVLWYPYGDGVQPSLGSGVGQRANRSSGPPKTRRGPRSDSTARIVVMWSSRRAPPPRAAAPYAINHRGGPSLAYLVSNGKHCGA